MTEHIIVADDKHARIITLRRPEKKNAITHEMYRALGEAIDNAQNNPEIRCFIITGGSGVFTAGNDIEDFIEQGTSQISVSRASNALKFLYSLAHNTKPIIAAVDGIAVGVGTTMLFHCDYVLASKTAMYGRTSEATRNTHISQCPTKTTARMKHAVRMPIEIR